MAVAFVQKAINTTQTAVASITATGSAVGSGNLVVGTATWPSSTIASPNIKDGGGTLSAIIVDNVSDAGGPTTTITFYFANVTNGMTSVVFTPPSAQANGTGVEWHEVSGAALSSPLDGHNLATNASSSTTQTTPTITTAVNGDYIYASTFGSISGNSDITAAGGTGAAFTLRNNDSTNLDGGDSSAVQSTAGNVNGTFTIGAAQQYLNGIVAIKPASISGGLNIRPQNFRVNKFKKTLGLGPNAGLFQVRAYPIIVVVPTADAPASYSPSSFPPQWNVDRRLLHHHSPGPEFSLGVETNPHWQARPWPAQWNLNRSFQTQAHIAADPAQETNPHWFGRPLAVQWRPTLPQSAATDVPAASSADTPAYFIPRLWPLQWNLNRALNPALDVPFFAVDVPSYFVPRQLPTLWNINRVLGQNTAQDFSSPGVETNPHWLGRTWPAAWTPLTVLVLAPAADVPFVQTDTPAYFVLRTFPALWTVQLSLLQSTAQDFSFTTPDAPTNFVPRTWAPQWSINRALLQGTANDFSSPGVETPSYSNPRPWAPPWSARWNINVSLFEGSAQDFSSTPPVVTGRVRAYIYW